MELKIGNINASDLARKYKTPVYVYDENMMVNIMNDYTSNFKSKRFETEVIFASKAFACKAMFELVKNNNLGLDVVSGGELYGANAVDFNMDRIYFHGNNKSTDELKLALELNVGNIVVDNYDELVELEKLAKKANKKVKVLFRLNSGVEAHTHKFIVTSHIDSKFGMLFDSKDFKKCLDLLDKSQNLLFEGIHSHIGSQIFELNAFTAAIEKMVTYLSKLNKKLTLDLGGGFGVRYTIHDNPIPYSEVAKVLISKCEEELTKQNVEIKKLVIEPGRSIVAEAGYTLYKIGNIKKTPNKKYYFIDGGMTDNIRPALYQALYNADIVTKLDQEKTEKVSVAGKCCESGDIIIEEINLQKAKKGDILAVYSTGAYGYSMANNYNKNPKLPVVFVNDNKARLVVKRETYKDLYRNDCCGDVNEF